MKYLHTSLCALAVFVVATLGSPEQTVAHGEAGLTFTATSTSEDGRARFVDVDYTETEIISRDSTGRFTFDLFADEERTNPVEYTDLWVRIVQDAGTTNGRTVFAGPVYATKFGDIGFLFTFPESGAYTMHVRYNDANNGRFGQTEAEAEFPLTVLRSEDENGFDFSSVEFWIGLVLGAGIVLVGLLPTITGTRKTS